MFGIITVVGALADTAMGLVNLGYSSARFLHQDVAVPVLEHWDDQRSKDEIRQQRNRDRRANPQDYPDPSQTRFSTPEYKAKVAKRNKQGVGISTNIQSADLSQLTPLWGF